MFDWEILFGTEVIEALQSALSPTLGPLFTLFTLFGEAYLYLSLIAIEYWCYNKGGGVKTAYVLLASAYINDWMKLSFNLDRPPSEYHIILQDDQTHGFPGGHTQNAVTFWGWEGFKGRRAWVRLLSFTLIFVISVSRIYLGVHYLGDVIGGLLFGAVVLIGAHTTGPYLESKVRSLPRWLGEYLIPLISVLLFLISLAVFPDSTRRNTALSCGALFGFSLGVSLESKHVKSSRDVDGRTKVVRTVVGLITVFGLYLAITLVSNSLPLGALVYTRFVSYAIAAFTIALIMPLVFTFLEK